MPFESEAQRRWMYANKPEMAKRWERHTPKGAKLPAKVSKMTKTAKEIAAAVFDKCAENANLSLINGFLGEAQQRQQEMEEQRKQDIHEQQLQFNEDKHELEMQQLALNLQQAQEAFNLKQEQQLQKAQDDATAKRENAVQQQQIVAQQKTQEALQQRDQQNMQQNQWRQNIMAKAAAFYNEQGERISFSGGIPSAALGAGMGGLAAHYLFPGATAQKYRELAKAIGPEQITESLSAAKRYGGKIPKKMLETVSDIGVRGDKIKFKAPAHVRHRYFLNRALQSNAKRLLKGTGLGLLAGLAAHNLMEP